MFFNITNMVENFTNFTGHYYASKFIIKPLLNAIRYEAIMKIPITPVNAWTIRAPDK